jgi:hypothetical protein
MGLIIQELARRDGVNVVGVDIGGATTDVFSVFDGTFNRTVSANLGMSYSVSNVLAEAGIAAIQRWVPFDLEEHELRDRIGNKMIRPTTIPQTLDELKIEQAISREALRLSFVQHKQFAVKLRGGQSGGGIAGAFEQGDSDTLVDMMTLALLVGSGGVLSHAPRRAQSMMMMIDAFAVEGVTELAVDSIFMMPHLGVLSTIHPAAATEVFEKDCLVRLGTCVAPVGGKRGVVLECDLRLPGGAKQISLAVGDLQLLPLGEGETCEATLTPAAGVDVGAGPGQAAEQDAARRLGRPGARRARSPAAAGAHRARGPGRRGASAGATRSACTRPNAYGASSPYETTATPSVGVLSKVRKKPCRMSDAPAASVTSVRAKNSSLSAAGAGFQSSYGAGKVGIPRWPGLSGAPTM